VRVWIDTDLGTDPDDSIARLTAVVHPDVEVVGVSTVDGDVEWRAELARGLVGSSLPVIAGYEGLTDGISAARPDALLAIGPLTNVARLVEADVCPHQLSIMGGVLTPLRHRGAVRDLEHNFSRDPVAAATVLSTHDAVLLVPLDVTAHLRLGHDDLERLRASAPGMTPDIETWFATQRRAGVAAGEAAVVLHDPLALLALVGDAPIAVEQRTLAVDERGRVFESPNGRTHDVVISVDARAAIDRVLGVLEP